MGDINFRLNPSGRFSHSRHYVGQVMEESGFTIAQLDDATMRREANSPVPTLVAVGIADAAG